MTAQPRLLSRPLFGLFPGLLNRLRDRLRDRLRPTADAARAVRKGSTEPEAEADLPGACGWFDSSHELVHGLQVQELTTPESQAAALPLATWLQLQLDDCGAAQPA